MVALYWFLAWVAWVAMALAWLHERRNAVEWRHAYYSLKRASDRRRL